MFSSYLSHHSCRQLARGHYAILRKIHGAKCTMTINTNTTPSSDLNVKTSKGCSILGLARQTHRSLHNGFCGTFLTHCHNFSSYTALNAQKTFEFNTSPFGEIVIFSENNVETTVLPLDPQKCPLQNKVIIDVHTPDSEEVSPEHVQVCQENGTVRLSLNRSNGSNSKVTCVARLPIKYDVGANIKGNSNIYVEKFENEHINIHCEAGACRLKSIQTGTVDVETRDGDITCEGVLQGNTHLKVMGEGSINVHRIQGITFKAETKSGAIGAKAVYADFSAFSAQSGDVQLGSCHRCCSISVQEAGNVHIGSLDGDITVDVGEGNIGIDYIAQHENIKLNTQNGDINIKLSDKLKTFVNLEGNEISMSNDFDTMIDLDENFQSKGTLINGVIMGNAFEETGASDLIEAANSSLSARAGHGKISIECADWLSSLNLIAKRD